MALHRLARINTEWMRPFTGIRWIDVAAWVAVISVWAMLWSMANIAGVGPYTSLWYPPAALTFSLLISGGRKALPLAIAAPLLHTSVHEFLLTNLVPPMDHLARLLACFSGPLAHVIGYAIAAYGLRRLAISKTNGESTYELTPTYSIGFVGFALAGSALASVLGAANSIHQTGGDWSARLDLFLHWWSGDFLGVVTLTPLFLLSLASFPFRPLLVTRHPFKANPGGSPQFGNNFWLPVLCTVAFIATLLWLKVVLQFPIPYSLPFLIGIAGFALIALRSEITEVATMIAIVGLVGAVGVREMGNFELVTELDFFIPACVLASLLSHTMRNLLIRNVTLANETLLDPLTGVFNRRGLNFNYAVHLRGIQGGRRRLCLAAMDLDRFKQINDTLGHAVGDEVLNRVIRILQRHTSANDCIARIGGDEIVLLLPGLSLEECKAKIESVRFDIAAISDFSLPISASFGVVQVEPEHSQEVALAKADELLYEAKKWGRNRVEI